MIMVFVRIHKIILVVEEMMNIERFHSMSWIRIHPMVMLIPSIHPTTLVLQK